MLKIYQNHLKSCLRWFWTLIWSKNDDFFSSIFHVSLMGVLTSSIEEKNFTGIFEKWVPSYFHLKYQISAQKKFQSLISRNKALFFNLNSTGNFVRFSLCEILSHKIAPKALKSVPDGVKTI